MILHDFGSLSSGGVNAPFLFPVGIPQIEFLLSISLVTKEFGVGVEHTRGTPLVVKRSSFLAFDCFFFWFFVNVRVMFGSKPGMELF